MFLIVTAKDDLTTDYLIRRLQQRNQPFFRFNTEDLLSGFEVSLTIQAQSSEFTIADSVRGVAINSEDISAAYFRKPRIPALYANAVSAEEHFNRRELLETLRSIWRLIPETKWLNSPEALWLASNKVKQLKIASEIGFRTPPTLISSHPQEIITFKNRHHNNVIAKAVKHGFLESDELSLIFTTPLDSEDLGSINVRESVIPAIVQPRLDKQCDLRVTVVGDRVFPVAILSQENNETSVDWRTWDIKGIDLVHQPFDLPKALSMKCVDLNRRLNLRFSCIDMVKTIKGEFYFLEVNPNGQWAWIEDMVHFPIRDAIIDLLLRGDSL